MDVTNIEAVRPREAPETGKAQGRKRYENPPPGRQPPPREAASISAEEMDSALADLSGRINLKVEQTTDDESGRKVVRIMTRDGERLLRQMPTEAALKLLEDMRAGAADGLFSSVF